MAKGDTVTISRATLAAMTSSGKIRATPEDAPPYEPDEAFWAKAEIVSTRPPRKVSVHLRLDPDVMAFFKTEGAGHLTRMAQVLKTYAKAKSRSTGLRKGG